MNTESSIYFVAADAEVVSFALIQKNHDVPKTWSNLCKYIAANRLKGWLNSEIQCVWATMLTPRY